MNARNLTHTTGLVLIGLGLASSMTSLAASLQVAPQTSQIWTGFALASAGVIIHDIPSVTWNRPRRQTLFLATCLLTVVAVTIGLKVQSGSFVVANSDPLNPIVATPLAAAAITSVPIFFTLVALYLRYPR